MPLMPSMRCLSARLTAPIALEVSERAMALQVVAPQARRPARRRRWPLDLSIGWRVRRRPWSILAFDHDADRPNRKLEPLFLDSAPFFRWFDDRGRVARRPDAPYAGLECPLRRSVDVFNNLRRQWSR